MEFVFARMRDFDGGEYGVAIATHFKIVNHTTFYYHHPSVPFQVILKSSKTETYIFIKEFYM